MHTTNKLPIGGPRTAFFNFGTNFFVQVSIWPGAASPPCPPFWNWIEPRDPGDRALERIETVSLGPAPATQLERTQIVSHRC